MSLNVMIGRSGTGKTSRILAAIHEQLMQDPMGPPIWMIVPDQMTFHMEQAINELDGVAGITRLQVFSFSRLALRVLENAGGATRTHLTPVGIAMLIRKAVEDHRESLRVFKKAADQSGFYEVLQRTFSEFKRYGVTEELLAAMQTEMEVSESSSSLILDKLKDLQTIYSSLNQALIGKYIDSDDYLTFAAEKIKQWPMLKEATIFIDGFDQFTPQEWLFLKPLLCESREVTLTLTLDESQDPSVPSSQLSLFKRSSDTYRKLMKVAKEWHLSIEKTIVHKTMRRFKSPMLAHLEQAFDKRPFQTTALSHDESVMIIEAANRRTEIEEMARRIQSRVMNDNRRYKDMAILVRDLSSYQDLIETIFADYKIPIFTDQKRSMHHHPLIEFIRSSLEAILQNWRYEPVFRALKTDFLFPRGEELQLMREQLDQLENYCLAYGINGKQWKSQEKWEYHTFRGLEDQPKARQKDLELAQNLNHWRHTFTDPLLAFERKIKQAKTVEERCTELYRFLEGLEVPERIERLRNTAEAEGRLSDAREHDQAWNALLEVLDQLVEAAGQEKWSFEIFTKVLDSGLDQLKFSLIPPALDQVIVGSLDRTRVEGVKELFILGVNEGVLPAKPMEDGLLSDEERLSLQENGFQLAPTARDQLFYEEFLIYKAVTSPSERLVLSYPIASEEGQALMPSSFIRRMGYYFSGIKPVFVSGDPTEGTPEEQLSFVSSSMRTLSHTSMALRRWQNSYPISDIWWETYNYFMLSESKRKLAIRILSSRFYKNEEPALKPETAEALYGKDIQASVSRMELYNRCPFSQFASYGLRLKERDVYRLEAPDIGQLFHAALKMMTDQLRENKREWSALTSEECLSLASTTVEALAPRLQREILLSSPRYHYLKRKLEEIVGRVAVILAKHASVSGFSPIGLELPFGPGKELPPLTFSLKNGGTMQLVGRIDRVDRGENAEGVYLRIIDYKSGKKNLDLSEVYYGLALQMLAYLDVVLTHSMEWLGEEAEPAGVLYFHLHNPLLSFKTHPDADELEKSLLKEFKMKGLLMEEKDMLKLMDQGIEDGGGLSLIAPFGFNKNGSLHKSSTVATKEQFDQLRQYTRQVFEKVGNEIVSGTISISPYKLKDRMPCTYCDFKSLCQFDPSQPGNTARVLDSEDDRPPLEKMIEALGISH
ncbi:helicase-exonuclease AddAB subunit AddB [Pullulanibacillus sp. KACC 23026]|uniref:helicase-exonuclease AddAB subunit AddB n=1 Tax=Pullulanibacillus sp. KACC 23026 TaxID=3028315 RepID=UPI0023AF30EB|nr:helicase-exonuclease AddAB subunit AddB [Pullulanibacillus sp. KACC 23026]WEG11961.1 helicase-exonuclease AddAB subunit AddB [Pullulanibacillus sp. KACC 23026]